MTETTITLKPIRRQTTVTVRARLLDNGVRISWPYIDSVKAYIYSDVQRNVAGKCTTEIDGEDDTLLICRYDATEPQYLGVQRLVLCCEYSGQKSTYDKPAFVFVATTAETVSDGTSVAEDSTDVEISVKDVDSSILSGAIQAALDAAEFANEKGLYADEKGDYALEQGNYAKDQGDYAKNMGDYAKQKGDYALEQGGIAADAAALANQKAGLADDAATLANQKAGLANDAATLANTKAGLANDAATLANTKAGLADDAATLANTKAGLANDAATLANQKAGYASEQGDYAKAQGDYAKEKGDAFAALIVDNLTTNDPAKALSAKQGRVLNDNLSQLGQEVICDINGVNGASVTIAAEAGSGHAATEDVVFINIPSGQKFYVSLPKNSLGIRSISVYVKYREDNSLIYIGSVSRGEIQEFTAANNITSVGYYFEAPSTSGNITIDIYTEKSFPYYEKKLDDVKTVDNSLFLGLLDVPNNISWSDGLILRNNGATVEVSGYMTSSFIPVTPGKTYIYMGSKVSSSYTSLAGYDSNQDFVQVLDSERSVENNKPLIVTIPNNVNYVRIGLVKSVSIYGGIWILQDNIIQLLIDRTADSMNKSISSVISLLNGILDVPNDTSWQDDNILKSDGTVVQISGYMVSAFIPVTSGKNYVYMGARVSSTFAALVGYNSSKEFVQSLDSERPVENNDPMIVTIPNGISYVRIGLVKSISAYGGIWMLKNNIIQMLIDDSNSSKEELTTKTPEYIYCACDNVVNKSLALYADHLVYLGNNIQKKLIFKESNSDHVNIYAPITSSPTTVYNEGQTKLEKTINATIVGDYKDKPISFKMRSILNTATENTPIRVLCIGDSVTAGTGSLYPIELTNYAAQQYWKLMAELCFDDRINHNRPNGYKFLSIGKQVRSKFTRSDVEYTVFAEGRGGWAVSNYLFDETYNGITNYFYDGGKSWTGDYANDLNAAGVKFSISSFLAKYKTLDDDGETRLVVGSTAGTEITDIYECDVCTPNIIVIQLSHNQNSTAFGQNIPLMIKAIKNEYPNIPIIISIIDETGCYNKELYPQFDNAALNWGTLHVNIFNDIDICKSLEQNFIGVYFCPSFAIQPTAWSVTTRNVKNAASLFRDFDFYAQIGNGANYHPSCFAHAAWAYQLLSCIKWILYNE